MLKEFKSNNVAYILDELKNVLASTHIVDHGNEWFCPKDS
jgi:hypothetical protein